MRIFMTMILSTIIGLVTLSIRIATILLQAGMGLKITLIVTQRQDHQYQHHAYQLSHMFMQDQVYLDSHGVREKEMVETPSLVFELMEHIKVQLQQIVLQGRPQAYHQAIQQKHVDQVFTGRIDGSKSSSTSYGPTL
jgi:hypothetical protein